MKKFFCGVLAVAVVGACGEMNETYKEFLGDGPIVYLAKYPDNSIVVHSGKKRLKLICPITSDPRVAKGTITWWADGGDQTQNFDVAQGVPTEILIDQHVSEGSYAFTLKLYDATGSYASLNMTVTGETYGDVYESLLSEKNRVLASLPERPMTRVLSLYFLPADVPPLYATQVEWKENGAWVRDTMIYPYISNGSQFSGDTVSIPNFYSDSLRYRAIFKPTSTFIDSFVVNPRYETNVNWLN
jgi:hypothetical protein